MENNYDMAYPPSEGQGTPIRQNSPHQSYHGYRHAGPSAIDAAPQSQRASFGNTNAVRMAGSLSPRPVRAGSIRSLQSSPRMLQLSPRFQRTGTPTSTVGRAAYSMSPPPLFDSISRNNSQRMTEHSTTHDAPLPPRDITDANIDDAYVKFILFANPAVPRDVDTTQLRRVFRAPPRSDGKSFSIYTLWQLIKKLENKELKTWSQLAIELGVEPPCTERGQSAQKIQQYAVRLKRWMRAMHIDAFFDFCLGKPHRYYNELPIAAGNGAEESRDGVPIEEDLALRALVPEWRPKRGRRKNDEKESEVSSEQPPAKHPRLDAHPPSAVEYDGLGMHSAIFPGSAAPWSAYTDDMNHDGWMVGSAMSHSQDMSTSAHPNVLPGRIGNELPQWRRNMSPAVYPRSAVTLGHRQPEHVINEPQSAITPSVSKKSQPRRRHGPAVSSAWPSQGSSAGSGKQRGRPPSSKPLKDEGPLAPSSSGKSEIQRAITPPVRLREERAFPRTNVASQSHPQQSLAPQPRPNKLQLRVPEHYGGPVRLATPPTVLVNGNGRLRRDSVDYFRHPEGDDDDDASVVVQEEKRPGEAASRFSYDFTVEDVARAFATRLLGVKIIGRPDGLSLEEANMLACKATLSICGGEKNRLSSPSTHHVLAIKSAIMLGVEKEMGIPGACNTVNDSHLNVRCFFQNPDGSISRRRKSNATNNTNNNKSNSSDNKGSYNYTISIDKTTNQPPHPSNLDNLGTFSSNIQIRDLIIPVHTPSSFSFSSSSSSNLLLLPGGSSNSNGGGGAAGGIYTTDESGFAQLREQIKNLSEIPTSAIEPPLTALTNGAEEEGEEEDADGDADGDATAGTAARERENARKRDRDRKSEGERAWKMRFLDVRREEMVAEEKLRRLKRLMLEVVMGSQ